MPPRRLSLPLDLDYRSDRVRIGRDLVAKLLPGAATYDRAAGFFSSSVFQVASREFAEFFVNSGVMRLVTCPVIEAHDLDMIKRAVIERSAVRRYWETVDEAFKSENWAAVLGYLISTDRLQMRVAIPRGSRGGSRIYHEKIAVFRDDDGHAVALSGSANESAGGLSDNFERVDAFPNWRSEIDKQRCWRIEEQFRTLWNNDTAGLDVLSIVDAFRSGVWSVRTHADNESSVPMDQLSSILTADLPPEVLIPPPNVQLRPHQISAIQRWSGNGGKGIIEMATGSGKTLTALALATRLKDRLEDGLAILIVAPLIHLVDQWCAEAKRYGLNPVRCAEGYARWSAELDAAIAALNSGGRSILSIATTADTLGSSLFQSAIKRIRKPALIIADEVHNYGSASGIAALPSNFALRIGLSATPDRWYDEGGTKALHGYFGPVVYKYSLRDAIRDGVLTPYRYYPKIATLEEDELEAYLELTALIARYSASDSEDGLPEGARRLLIQRARLLSVVRSKMTLLRQVMQGRRSETHILVYCGDGSVEGPVGDETVRQVDAVVRMLGVELGMRVAPYVAETVSDERQRLLRDFTNGDVQVLVAIRCLDEGVDVPVARTGLILASSTNPRQFIQRRGRLLRTALGKSRAEIFDLFAAPDTSRLTRNSREWKMARSVLGGQIQRAREFADLAENGPVARASLLELCEKMDLLSFWGASE